MTDSFLFLFPQVCWEFIGEEKAEVFERFHPLRHSQCGSAPRLSISKVWKGFLFHTRASI